MNYTDALNRTINLPNTPQRIISLVPSLTELLHDMSLEPQVVGITKYCVHPVHYKHTKAIVGGTKAVKNKTIADLSPDFILCSKEENTPKMVEELEKIAPVYVTDVNSFDDALALIKELGLLLNRRTEASYIIDRINFRYNTFLKSIKESDTYKVAYFIWANPFMVAGGKTFISDMLRICKFENAYENKERYPEINIGIMKVTTKPDIFLFSSEPHDFTDEEVYEVLRKNNKTLTVYVDGEYFAWYGSRLIKAFDHFTQLRKKIDLYFEVANMDDHDHDHSHGHSHEKEHKLKRLNILDIKKLKK